PATFVVSAIEELGGRLTETFDVVFTSYGVLCWLSDLRAWAEAIARHTRPGGFFYIVEMHPLADMLADGDGGPRLAYSYFPRPEAIPVPVRGSSADRSRPVSQPVSYQWAHSLAEVVTALLDAGMRIDSLREHAVCPYAKFAGMVEGDDGYWRLPEGAVSFPL